MSATENKTYPVGYQSLVPLDKTRHGGQGVDDAARWRVFATANAIPLTAIEFPQAARHYPIVFVTPSDGSLPLACAVTGLRRDENLFVTATGWRAGAYLPAHVRRWPFFATALPDKPDTVVILVDEQGLSSEATTPLFAAADGAPLAAWAGLEKLTSELETAQRQTATLVKRLQNLKLLEPFNAQAMPASGAPFALRGMLRVNETRLHHLDAKTLKQLATDGWLARIYAHLLSLDNFQSLLEYAQN